MTRLSLVCPAYQDEGNIGKVVERALGVLPALADEFEIVVVDDGSLDHTGEQALKAAGNDPRVRLIRHPENLGYGRALKTGLAAVRESDLICLTDGDGQYDLADLRHLMPFLGSYDAVTGSRRVNQNPWHRRLMSIGFNTSVRLLFRVPFRDLTSSLKLFRREILPEAGLTSNGNFTDVELFLRAARKGFRIKEVPIEHHARLFGRSHSMSVRRILETFLDMGRVYRSL